MTRDFSARGARPSRVPGWIVVALPAAALVSVLIAAQTARTSREAAAADLQRVQRETEDARTRVAALTRDPRLAGHPARDAAPGAVLAAVASAMPDDVRLQSMALSWDREAPPQLRLQVEAAGPEAWDAFVQQLATHPRLGSVLPGDETREGAVRATVTAAWKR